MSLLGSAVKLVNCEKPNTLKLVFNTNEVVELVDDSEIYESFNIIVDGKVIVR